MRTTDRMKPAFTDIDCTVGPSTVSKTQARNNFKLLTYSVDTTQAYGDAHVVGPVYLRNGEHEPHSLRITDTPNTTALRVMSGGSSSCTRSRRRRRRYRRAVRDDTATTNRLRGCGG